MKIKVDKGMDKPYLSDGRHQVEITDIQEGESEHKGVPFFACRFDNEEGYVVQRFYTSGPGMAIITGLFEAVGVSVKEGSQIDTNQLLHKKLLIEVNERTYNDLETGSERTLKQASNFQPLSKKVRT